MAITTRQLTAITTICIATLLAANPTAYAQFGLGDLLGGGGRNLGNGQLRNAMQQAARISQPQSMGSVLRNMPVIPPQTYPQPKPQPITQPPVCQYPSQPVQPPVSPAPPAYRTVHASPAASVPVAPAPATAAMTEMQQARSLVAEAKRLFAGGDYSRAQPKLEELVALAAKDSNAYQFRSFVNFANEDYDAAAADAYDALLVGNTWDWPTVYSLYQDAEAYKRQLRKLEVKSKVEPSMSVHFLLGYQYLVLGHLERGQKQLEMVLAIQPEEELVTQLVSVVQNLRDNPTK